MNPLPFLRSLSPAFWLRVVGVMLVVAICLALYASGKRSERVKQAEIATQAVTQARDADEAAHGVISVEKASTALTEAEAREAAAQSDDPLKAGLDSLRNEK